MGKNKRKELIDETLAKLRWLLLPFALLYGLVTYFRNKFYDWGIFRVKKFPVGVVSIGNLSVGGTGKTPLAEMLIRDFQHRELQVAYLSRGYGRKTKGYLRVDPEEHTARESGDEALQVASKFPEIRVAVCESRTTGVAKLLKEFPKLEVVVLDDAMQHRKIHRNLNITAIEAQRPPWKDFMLPVGRLREFASGVRRADLVFVNKVLDVKTKRAYRKKMPKSELVFTRLERRGFLPFSPSGEPLELSDLNNRYCVAFSALGHNKQFYKGLRELGLKVYRFYGFPDHHEYTQNDLNRILRRFKQIQNDEVLVRPPIILTTEKDFVRLRKNDPFMEAAERYPFYYLEVYLRIIKGEDKFDREVRKVLLRSVNAYKRAQEQENA